MEQRRCGPERASLDGLVLGERIGVPHYVARLSRTLHADPQFDVIDVDDYCSGVERGLTLAYDQLLLWLHQLDPPTIQGMVDEFWAGHEAGEWPDRWAGWEQTLPTLKDEVGEPD